LFNATNYAGIFAAITPAIPGDGLAWNTNTLTTDGTLRLTAIALPTPHFTSVSVSGTTLTIQGTNGADSGPYVLLGTTNLTLPISQWTPLLTNSFAPNGSFNLSTNIINPSVPHQFFLIEQ
jgi:hypothetical protein